MRGWTGRKRVMVVSQPAGKGLSVADSLATAGYEVAVMCQTEDVLVRLTEMRPDAVVLDVPSVRDEMRDALSHVHGVRPTLPVFALVEGWKRDAEGPRRQHAAGSAPSWHAVRPPELLPSINAKIRDRHPFAMGKA